MKQPQPIKATVAERPTASDTLASIVDLAIAYRFPNREPSLADVVRVTGASSRALRYDSIDERISTENTVVMSIAKQRGLVG